MIARIDALSGRKLAVLAALIGLGAAVEAHEFWVSIDRWAVEPGSQVTVLVNVGDRFPEATSYTTPDRVETVRIVGPGIDRLVQPTFVRKGESLGVSITVPAPGSYVTAVTIKPRTIEIEPIDFTKYLKAEGLTEVLAERERRAEAGKPGRERYSRYGKTLVHVGSGGSRSAATRLLGLRVELVPLTDPTTLQVGDKLRLRLLFEGRSVSDAQVGAIYATAQADPDEWPVTRRTDARGEVELELNDPGPWLVRAVQMMRTSREPGAGSVDWESYWASLTFSLSSSGR